MRCIIMLSKCRVRPGRGEINKEKKIKKERKKEKLINYSKDIIDPGKSGKDIPSHG